MRILIVTSGTYEYFFSIAGQLLELGHEVYIFHYEHLGKKNDASSRDTVDPNTCDLVITANILDSPFVLKVLDGLQVHCPIISIVWGNPIEEIAPLWQRHEIQEVNNHLKHIDVHLWVSCNRVEEEYRRLGFGSSFYAPLGISDKYVRLSNIFRWLHPGQDICKPTLDIFNNMANPPELNNSPAKIIYRGILPKKPETHSSPKMEKLARDTAMHCFENPRVTRLEFEQVWLALMSLPEAQRTEQFMAYDAWFNYYLSQNTRRSFVHRLKREFGDQFLLFGDDWVEENIKSEPTSIVNRELIYNRIPISIDFGSTNFETCFFPRPIEIIKVGGCLVSYRRPDSDLFFKDSVDKMVFDNEDQMCERVEGLLNSDNERDLCRQAVHKNTIQEFGLKKILSDIIAQVTNS
jgi:hypothetical protein